MKFSIFPLLLLVFPKTIIAQSDYTSQLLMYRQQYKENLLTKEPKLKPGDTGHLRFYAPDQSYKAEGIFEPVLGSKPFLMNNKHGGVKSAVKEYGTVYFNMRGATITLHIYAFENGTEKDKLIIPFTDMTNYVETFQGGRYVELYKTDIKNNKVVIDFNKCINPHTAYEKGYPYMIPPPVNSLKLEIKAGEKIFGHNPGY